MVISRWLLFQFPRLRCCIHSWKRSELALQVIFGGGSVGLSGSMEANFTFLSQRQSSPFHGEASRKRLMGLFLIEDERLAPCARMICGMDFGSLKHRYKTNMDVYSLIAVWGLDLGEPMEFVKQVMKKIAHEDFLVDLESIFEWAISGVGLDYFDGLVDEEMEEIFGVSRLKPFIRWPKGNYKACCREEARLGWKALKLFIELMEVEEFIE